MKNTSNKFKCVVVDDDELSIELIKNYIENLDFLYLEASFTNPAEGIKYLQENKIDILFCDIQMPVISGIELVRSLDDPPNVIMTTSSINHAIDAYDCNVVDYLVKPVAFDRFLKACKKVKKHEEKVTNKSQNDSLFVKINSQMIRFNINDILFVEANGDYVSIHTTQNKYVASTTLREIEETLDPVYFTRIHRSYIVALNKIDKISNNQVFIKNEKLPISSSFKEHLLSLIKLL